MTPQVIAALFTGATGMVLAILAQVHSWNTRKQVNSQDTKEGQ